MYVCVRAYMCVCMCVYVCVCVCLCVCVCVNVNVNVNICNALEFPKEQKRRYLQWSIEAKMVKVCFELRSE